MAYTITPSEENQYLICRVSGEITVSSAEQVTMELDRVSRERRIKRFLYDVREAKNVMSNFQNYDYAYKEMSKMNLQRDVRSAILTEPDDHSHDFVETVMRNAGYSVRLFRDRDTAVAWLCE